MIEINSRADEILSGKDQGLFYLQIPPGQAVATIHLTKGAMVLDANPCNLDGYVRRAYTVEKVELIFKLMDPPIPCINLLVRAK